MVSKIEINFEKSFLNLENQLENTSISKIDPSITYNEFFEKFMLMNKPCIFHSAITKDWPCRNAWKKKDEPNFQFLKESFGNCKVPIANCNKKYFNAQQKDDMLIKSYLDYWINFRNSNYSNKLPLLYLKDWHCKKYSNLSIYNVPKFFASDWLNEYFNANPHLNDDYMFVYMGPKGSWTPLHVDVFTSYSWSANIVGRKKWLLFPPGQENHLKDSNGELIYNLNSDHLSSKTLKSFEVIQEAGEIIFVPSGWYHQVWNLEDTISINHNWINGCNVLNVWNSLKKELLTVRKEIDDCKDMDNWEQHCQKILKTSFGIDYLQFYEFLSFIAENRLNYVINNVPIKNFNNWVFGEKLVIFDLRQIKIILENLIEDTENKCIHTIFWNNNEPQCLLNKINSILNNLNN